MTDGDPAPRLLEVLGRAQEHGFIGPGPLDPHLRNAETFLAALTEAPPGAVVDLGTGGGLPALALAVWAPVRTFLLVESNRRRATFLAEAVGELDVGARVRVAHARAEEVARDHRGRAAVVTARAFGPPSVTAECAAPFLRTGGWLLVSEPPLEGAPGTRWPATGLAQLGQVLGRRWVGAAGTGTVQGLVQTEEAPEWVPRRVGVAAKRPLFVEGSG